jgi:hypothetical protein
VRWTFWCSCIACSANNLELVAALFKHSRYACCARVPGWGLALHLPAGGRQCMLLDVMMCACGGEQGHCALHSVYKEFTGSSMTSRGIFLFWQPSQPLRPCALQDPLAPAII